MRRLIAALAALVTSSCATNAATKHITNDDPCQWVQAVLRDAIKPHGDEPLLDLACVKKWSGVADEVWVDARIYDAKGVLQNPTNCALKGFNLRFGSGAETKTKADGILYVTVDAMHSPPITFHARIEDPDWHERKPNTYGVSPCGVANGRLVGKGTSTKAEFAPQAPTDL